MDLQLDGRTAVVTGAGKGIGLAITRALVAEGVHVVAGSRTLSPELESLQSGGAVTFVGVDLASVEGSTRLLEVAAVRGGVDILVNNVGAVTPRTSGFAAITDEEWAASFNLTFLSAVRTVRAALPELIRRGGGSIVTISSVNAFLPDPTVIDYSAAKAALTNFSKSLSKNWAGRGSASIPSALARCKRSCGSASTEWPRRWRRRADQPPTTSSKAPRPEPRLGGSPSPKRLPTWCCSSPAIVRGT